MSEVDSRMFAKTHEWVRPCDEGFELGISAFAQGQLGDVVYVDLPAVGSTVTKGESIVAIDSVKAAAEVYAPASGVVMAVNDALADEPELVNTDPLEAGWMVRIKGECPSDLLTPQAYTEHTAQ